MSVTTKIAILGTGGTIAGAGQPQGAGLGYKAGQITVANLLQSALGSEGLEHVQLATEQVAQIDSKDMDIPVWQSLAQACHRWLDQKDVQAVVVTHGTDTLEETAWFLQRVVQPSKPLVLTCAMRPATALSADGPSNLRDAVMAAQQLPAGVWVVVAGEVHSAQGVRKVHPYRLQAFASASGAPAGWVEEGRLRLHSPAIQAVARPPLAQVLWMQPSVQWPWVEVLTSGAAARPAAVDALVAAGVDGLVVAATGNGSVHHAWMQALDRAQSAGVAVVRTTRCEQGQIVSESGIPWTPVSSLSPVKARVDLMLNLLVQRGMPAAVGP